MIEIGNGKVISVVGHTAVYFVCIEPSAVEKLIEEENLRLLERKIQANLSPYESRVWWMYVSGMSAQDIAARIDTADIRSVNNAIYRIRKKLRAVLAEK